MVGIPTQLPLFLAHLAQKPKEQVPTPRLFSPSPGAPLDAALFIGHPCRRRQRRSEVARRPAVKGPSDC